MDGFLTGQHGLPGTSRPPVARISFFIDVIFTRLLFPRFFSVTVLDSSLQVNKHDAGVCLGPPGIVFSVKKLSDRTLTVFYQTQFYLLLQRFTLDGKFKI